MTDQQDNRLEAVMRLESLIINDATCIPNPLSVLEKANSDGYIPDLKKRMDKLKITGLYYTSISGRNNEAITFEQYASLGRPEFIMKTEDGSVIDCPEEIVAPLKKNFPPRRFER